MDREEAYPSNGQRRSAQHEASSPPPQKRRRVSASPGSSSMAAARASPSTPIATKHDAGQTRVKKEPRERWVEIEAQYATPSPSPQTVNDNAAGESSSGAQCAVQPNTSSSLSSSPSNQIANKSTPAGQAAPAAQHNGGAQGLPFPPPGKPWPPECEEAFIRYIAKDDAIRTWAESGGDKTGIQEGLQHFIDLHGLSVSLNSLENKLRSWGIQYSGFHKRLSETGQSTRTPTWTNSFDKSILGRDKSKERLQVWHDEVYLHWQSPNYVSPKRKSSRSARARSGSQASTLAGPSGSRARRSSSRATSSFPSTAVASGAPKSSLLAAAGSPANPSPSAKTPVKKQLKVPKVSTEGQLEEVLGQLKDQTQRITRLESQNQRLAATIKRQAQQAETRATEHSESLEALRRQLQSIQSLLRQRSR